MGCCSSSTNKSTTEKSQFPNNSKLHSNRTRRTDPFPVPLPEEESVKQVLSETPIIPKAFRKSNELRRIPYSFPKNLSNPDGIYHKHSSIFKNPHISQDLTEDFSEVQSECLSSASFLTEENYSDVRRISPMKMRDRSASDDFSKGVVVANSNPSPNRVRSRRDGFSPNTRKRDSGESLGRRSVSPALRGSPVESGKKKGLGRSVSAGRKRLPSDRVKPELGGMKIEDRNQSHRENQWPPTSNESLENPLVSLECFIFL